MGGPFSAGQVDHFRQVRWATFKLAGGATLDGFLQYAATLNVTAKYLSVVCKRESGKTALAWIQEYILEDIRFYLSDPTLSIKEIADTTGFSNLSFFGRFVCQHFGCSPREYRARLAEEQNKNYVNNTEKE